MTVSVCKTMNLQLSLIAILLVTLVTHQVISQELSSTLHLTPYGVQFAYEDEMVVFTCAVKGSNSITWTSDEYIGANQPLTLVSAEPVGHEVRAVGNDQTVAVLRNATTDVIIISELHVRISSAYPVASVQCVNSGTSTNPTTSTSFFLAGAALVACDRQSVCPGDTLTCICATGNSSALAWMTNGRRLEFTSSDPLLMRRSVLGLSGFAVLTENSNANGVRVIMSNLTLFVSMNLSDISIVLTCENVDHTISNPVILPIVGPETCLADQVSTTPTGNENTPVRGDCAGPIAVAVVVPLIIVIIVAVVIVIILAMRIHKMFKAQLKEKNERISSLDQNVKEKGKKIGNLEQNIEEMTGKIRTLEQDIEEKRGALNTLKQDVEKKKGMIRTLEQTVHEKDELIGVKDEELGNLRKMEGQTDKEKQKALEDLIDTVKDVQKEALETLESNMKNNQKRVLQTLKDNMKTDIEQALEGESEEEGAVTNLNTALRNLKARMEEALQVLDDGIKTEVDEASRKLKSKMEEGMENVMEKKGFIKAGLEKVGNLFSRMKLKSDASLSVAT